MNFYDEFSNEFSEVSQRFKDGNRLAFFQDMAHVLSDLQYTVGMVLLFTTYTRLASNTMAGPCKSRQILILDEELL